VQLFQTDLGVGRRVGDQLEILVGVSDLHEFVVDGGLIGTRIDELADAEFSTTIPLESAVLHVPVRPKRLIQVGLNYHSHLAEVGRPVPDTPMFAVTDTADTLSDPGATVTFPDDDPDQVDHECEVAIVIGAAASALAAADAWSIIAGLTACNDVSARGLQRKGFAEGNFGAGKMLTGFKPLGPGLILAPDASVGPLEISLTVNGEERQRASTADMVFSIPELIEIITRDHALEPGDVVMTGSPAGVGFFTGKFLHDGDVVDITLADLPPLRTRFALRDSVPKGR
jgi:2-keto-4-pentenoate hydratase/2-oxohepta-3-ene-1,7-dioic acid hydratase in catechol pathway